MKRSSFPITRSQEVPRARALFARDDGASLMILAGIVLTLGFILATMTLSQVSTLEREAATEKATALTSEWRFMHDRVETNLRAAITPSTTIDSFKEDGFVRVGATFRNLHEERGYDSVIRLAGADHAANEATDLVLAGQYSGAYTPGGALVTEAAYDGVNDGILWETPCPFPEGPATGCIVGVYLFVRLADTRASMAETILFDID